MLGAGIAAEVRGGDDVVPLLSSISVVIPTYNRARLVKRAVDSVLQQSVPPGQVIVVDDGSTDETAEALRPYGDALDYVWQRNVGAAAARNSGIRVARHPWTAFLDSDDYWTPRHLERIAAAIARTDGEGRFYFSDMGFAPTSSNATLWEVIGFRPQEPYQLTRDATAWMLMRRQPTMIQCSVFSTAVLRETGGFHAGYRVTEDVELFCRVGIGSAATAVTGIGCVHTSDAEGDDRLSATVTADVATYWRCQVMLWCGVLARFPGLPSPYRRLVRYNLASARFRLSRCLWHSGHRTRSARVLLQSVWAQPGFLAWVIRHRTTHGCDAAVRQWCAEIEQSAQGPFGE